MHYVYRCFALDPCSWQAYVGFEKHTISQSCNEVITKETWRATKIGWSGIVETDVDLIFIGLTSNRSSVDGRRGESAVVIWDMRIE